DNQVDPGSGTVRARAVVANPDRAASARALPTGLFVRVRLPVGRPYRALLVAEQAVLADKGHQFVYVVNDKNVVEGRPVKLGGRHGQLRVVRDGLGREDLVAVSDLARLRPGQTVQTRVQPMPGAEGWPPPDTPEGGAGEASPKR